MIFILWKDIVQGNANALCAITDIAYWYDYISYAFIDTGNNNFKLFRFSKNHFEHCELIKPIKAGSNNYLKIFRKTTQPDTANKHPFSYKEVMIIDTLVFKFNDFIELGRVENANFEGIGYTKRQGKSSKRLAQKILKK